MAAVWVQRLLTQFPARVRDVPRGESGVLGLSAKAVVASGALRLGIIISTLRALPGDVPVREGFLAESGCRCHLISTLLHPLLDACKVEHAVAGRLAGPNRIILLDRTDTDKTDETTTLQAGINELICPFHSTLVPFIIGWSRGVIESGHHVRQDSLRLDPLLCILFIIFLFRRGNINVVQMLLDGCLVLPGNILELRLTTH